MFLTPTVNWSSQSNMSTFPPISSDDPIQEVIKQVFDMDLDIDGGWGYTQNNPIISHTRTIPFTQLQHTLASMRTHLEMSMTQPAEQRYGGINLTELTRETKNNIDKVIYRVTAMLESDYANFIAAYKEGYGTEAFDMEAHFKARKDATLERTIIVWFIQK